MTAVNVNALVFNETLYQITKGTNANNLLGVYTLVVTYEYTSYPGPI